MTAGTSSAVSLSRAVTANGPEPIGSRPDGSSTSWSTGMSASTCAGAIGWVAAWRKPPSGVARVKTTVRIPTGWTVTSFQEPAPGPLYFGSWRTRIVKATSSAVTGCPSCHVASSRSWNVQVAPVESTDQRSARSGTIVPFGPFLTSPE